MMPASTGLCRNRSPSPSRKLDSIMVPRLIRRDGAKVVVTQVTEDNFVSSRKMSRQVLLCSYAPLTPQMCIVNPVLRRYQTTPP